MSLQMFEKNDGQIEWQQNVQKTIRQTSRCSNNQTDRHTVHSRYIVALSFPTLVFSGRLYIKFMK